MKRTGRYLIALGLAGTLFGLGEAKAATHVWTHPSGTAGWVGKTVGIGLFGQLVFTEHEFGLDKAKLFSAFADDPARPMWTNSDIPMAAAYTQVAAAKEANAFVSMHQVVQNNNQNTRQSIVTLYSSSNPGYLPGTPEWSYAFPHITGGGARVAISQDGRRIVAVSHNNANNKLDIAIFATPATSTGLPPGIPVYAGEMSAFGSSLRFAELSADGSTLYVASAAHVYIWNTTSHSNVGVFLLPGGFDSHGISGNGSVFAFGSFNHVDVFERTPGGTYAHTYQREVPGQAVCSRLDISADGSTIAWAFNLWDTNLRVLIEAFDVPTKMVTMANIAEGTGTFQNVAGDISISNDGSRFVVGLWGDEGNACPELRFYEKYLNTPSSLVNLPGSVFDVDISPDGERVAVASKAVHANLFAEGGAIAFYKFDTVAGDLTVNGVPYVGSTISVDLWGPAYSPARLLVSPLAATTPFHIGDGILYLDRDSITAINCPVTGPDGRTRCSLPLPGGDAGQSRNIQGVFGVRDLTNDWEHLITFP